ncbi:unnamed protein product [Phytophthora lilii]|uniref:Unnamed protein product n=1 Tax=Phytophthora lilii TaxID=2077276 RepID=A0A9W6U8U5_9STRA|nr:unnamed protein product [Phytophthora lilii]
MSQYLSMLTTHSGFGESFQDGLGSSKYPWALTLEESVTSATAYDICSDCEVQHLARLAYLRSRRDALHFVSVVVVSVVDASVDGASVASVGATVACVVAAGAFVDDEAAMDGASVVGASVEGASVTVEDSDAVEVSVVPVVDPLAVRGTQLTAQHRYTQSVMKTNEEPKGTTERTHIGLLRTRFPVVVDVDYPLGVGRVLPARDGSSRYPWALTREVSATKAAADESAMPASIEFRFLDGLQIEK